MPAPPDFDDLLRPEEEPWRRHYANVPPAPTPGQLVYERWCGSNRSDHARYWSRMNPVEREAWEHMATEIRERMTDEDWQRFVHNIREYQ